MKIFITGGLGFVGRKLTETLLEKGHSITVVERSVKDKRPAPEHITLIKADATKPGNWQDRLQDHDAVINLAGASIFSRWSKKKKEAIYKSRILITRNVAEAIGRKTGGRIDLISTSAVGYYGFHGDEKLDEKTAPGSDFLAHVCRDWEGEALKAGKNGSRVAITRFGVVFGSSGGALSLMKGLHKMHLGPRLGSGKQWFSWIHEKDLSGIINFLLSNREIRGPLNCTSPSPVTNRELTQTLNKCLHTFSIVPSAPAFALRIILGEFGNFILKGQRAIPALLLEKGFTFRFPELKGALDDLLQ